MKKRFFPVFTVLLYVVTCACNGQKTGEKIENDAQPPAGTSQISTPVFDADSAYEYVSQQVAFGPRIPGSEAQAKCAKWMQHKLAGVCDTVYKQIAEVRGGDGRNLPCYNIIGVINPKAAKRILLLTHWDSRSWAEMDLKDAGKPILAADDGASGVGVLIEVARSIKGFKIPANIGIDILMTDVEDYGKSEWGEDSYCLGTQYWAHNPHVAGYKAAFGILLDMVGAHNASFPMEGISAQMASDIQQKVWQAASHAGYSSFFLYAPAPEITDDHLPVNKIAGIKTIDIINLTADPERPFASHWHTHADNMEIIDKATLKAVGQTLLQVIYEEGAQNPS